MDGRSFDPFEGLEICPNLDVDGKGYVFFQVDVFHDICASSAPRISFLVFANGPSFL